MVQHDGVPPDEIEGLYVIVCDREPDHEDWHEGTTTDGQYRVEWPDRPEVIHRFEC